MAAVTWAAIASSLACSGRPAAAARDGGGSGGSAGSGGGGSAGGGSSGGGGSGASISVSGSVLDTPFIAKDVAANSNGSPPVGTFPSLEISVTDIAGGACDDLARQRANSHVLRIYIFNEVDQTAIGPGTYTDLPAGPGTKFCGMVWHAFGDAVDGSCSTAPGDWASPATVTLTEVSATRVVGSFDATIAGDGIDAGARDAGVGHLSGSFSAPICPTIDGGATTCL